MKARLLIVNPEAYPEPPVAPMFLFEKEGQIYLYSTEWTSPIMSGRLEDVKMEDMDPRLNFRSNECAYLTEVREWPSGEWISPEVLDWLRNWWTEAATELMLHRPLALAS
jgi:hypothetical protein